MKYRQWKKNYKKKHGVNPPLELDKRKQRRLARKMARQINKTLPTAAETLPTAAETLAAAAEILAAALNRWVQSIKPVSYTHLKSKVRALSENEFNRMLYDDGLTYEQKIYLIYFRYI